nr:putative integron gene cassette protein [uncultured bacterium]
MDWFFQDINQYAIAIILGITVYPAAAIVFWMILSWRGASNLLRDLLGKRYGGGETGFEISDPIIWASVLAFLGPPLTALMLGYSYGKLITAFVSGLIVGCPIWIRWLEMYLDGRSDKRHQQ